MPRAKEKDLAGVLKDLEWCKQELGVVDVQVSLTTLEDVFLGIAKKVGSLG